MHDILHACHGMLPRGQYSTKKTSYEILQARYHWPTLHKDAQNYVSHYDEHQLMGKTTKRDELPLKPIVSYEPFDKWVIDLVGPLTLHETKKATSWFA